MNTIMHYFKDATVIVGLSLIVENVQQIKTVPFSDVEIVHVVTRSDF